MASKDQNSLNENVEKFSKYFQEDISAIDEELEKSAGYSKIIDDEIKKLSMPALGANKGNTRYLIDILEKAVALQSQRQGLRKDKFSIKKAIMDYASKFAEDNKEDSGDTQVLLERLNQLLEQDKKEVKEEKQISLNESENLDNEIDNILGDND